MMAYLFGLNHINLHILVFYTPSLIVLWLPSQLTVMQMKEENKLENTVNNILNIKNILRKFMFKYFNNKI